jgi:PAS domain S-box-containing protein
MQEISNFKGKVYDILIQNNPEPVFVYEKENLRFLEVNQTALSLYGYSKSEFLQMDLTDLYAPEDIQTLLGALNSNITEGVFSGPFRQKKKDGSFLHVEISKFSLKFNNKEAHYNVLRDVSKKLELEKQTQLFRSAFDNTEQLVFVTDSSGFIRFVIMQ